MRESEINPANKQDDLIQVTLHLLHINLDTCGRCWHKWRRGLNPSLTASSAISVSTGFFALDRWGNFRLSAPIPAGTAQGTQEEKSKMITKALLPRRNPAGPHGKDNTGTCGLPSASPNSPWARPRPHHALPSQLPAPPWQNFWRPQHYFQHSRPCILLTREVDKGSGNLPPFLDPSVLPSEAVAQKLTWRLSFHGKPPQGLDEYRLSPLWL